MWTAAREMGLFYMPDQQRAAWAAAVDVNLLLLR